MYGAELSSVSIRDMSAGDSRAVSRLILTLFNEFVAPGYSKEARKTFRRQTRRQSRCKELRPGEMRMVAMSGGELVGVIGVRDVSHVHWLWVRKDWHCRGVARSLMAHVIAAVCEQRPDVVSITLNSSPYAIPCYLRLGFQISGDKVDQKGIICTPMQLRLKQLHNTPDVAGIGVAGEA
jgi:ribosomal protein S18 acetylase RimI-like enzyme